MKESQTRLTFLDIMINKIGTKTWMDIYNKPLDSKRYTPFTPNHPRYCLTNTQLSFKRRICTIVENKTVKEKHFKELEKNITNSKISEVDNRS